MKIAARAASGGVPEQEAGKGRTGRKETTQMPIARKDKMSYERHNRIVHLLRTECSFPAASQLRVCRPTADSLFSHLQVRRLPADMPTITVPVSSCVHPRFHKTTANH
jgi:hypothetical protein